LRGDAGATAGNAYRADFSGTAFYVTEIPGGVHAPKIPMHRNDTLDYMAILSGRLILKLPDRDIELRQGDTLVQGGNDRSFANLRGTPACCCSSSLPHAAHRGGTLPNSRTVSQATCCK
jgi:mannose-6-phosphate isomerase-like protein (cupin superfamily)